MKLKNIFFSLVISTLFIINFSTPTNASDGPVVYKSIGVATHGSIITNVNTVGWLLMCTYSHSNFDDPIIHPGVPGASHEHDYFGNNSTDANSTYTSMTAATTTCVTQSDTSGNWQPSLMIQNNNLCTTSLTNHVRHPLYST